MHYTICFHSDTIWIYTPHDDDAISAGGVGWTWTCLDHRSRFAPVPVVDQSHTSGDGAQVAAAAPPRPCRGGGAAGGRAARAGMHTRRARRHSHARFCGAAAAFGRTISSYLVASQPAGSPI
jgi:hypothetical protein